MRQFYFVRLAIVTGGTYGPATFDRMVVGSGLLTSKALQSFAVTV